MSKKEEQFNGDFEDSELSEEESSEDSSDDDVVKKKKVKKIQKNRLIMNVSDTQYAVVKFVGKKLMNFKLSYQPYLEHSNWDLCWTDNAVLPETLAKMQPHQKINHMPGMYCLARKNHLGRNLTKMLRQFSEQYDFFPRTWLLPSEMSDFRKQFDKGTKTFIVKPEASCQGRGIFLTRNLDAINPQEHYVVQRYIHKPFLIDNLKFDFRIYVLIAGADPLRIYLHKEGLARFATQEYVPPHSSNLDDVCMHLTNYAINKDSPNFVFNQNEEELDKGHKRSYTSVIQLLKSMGKDTEKLESEIKDLIIKTFCAVQPILQQNYTQMDNFANNMCFEVLGFDILVDIKPYLLEVNHTPSFSTDTPLDSVIKKNIIRDTIRLMNVNLKTKNEVQAQKKDQMQRRVLTGKKMKYTQEEKRLLKQQAQLERDQYENANLGDYQKIYPIEGKSYDEYLNQSLKIYEEWTGANIRRASKKDIDQTLVVKPPPPKVLPKSKLYQNVQSKVNTNLYPKVEDENATNPTDNAVIGEDQKNLYEYRENHHHTYDQGNNNVRITIEENPKSLHKYYVDPPLSQIGLTCLSPIIQTKAMIAQQQRQFSIRKASKIRYQRAESDAELEIIKEAAPQKAEQKAETRERQETKEQLKQAQNGSFVKPKIFSLKIHQPQKGFKLQSLPILIQQNFAKFRYE